MIRNKYFCDEKLEPVLGEGEKSRIDEVHVGFASKRNTVQISRDKQGSCRRFKFYDASPESLDRLERLMTKLCSVDVQTFVGFGFERPQGDGYRYTYWRLDNEA